MTVTEFSLAFCLLIVRMTVAVSMMMMTMSTSARMQSENRNNITNQAYTGSDEHDLAINYLWVHDSVNGFDEQIHDESPNE
jgi:hypothetical protein